MHPQILWVDFQYGQPAGRPYTAGRIRNDIATNPQYWAEDKFHFYNPQNQPAKYDTCRIETNSFVVYVACR